MRIRVERTAREDGYTIGRMYLDGVYFCDTLEDTDRGLTSGMTATEIAAVKIAGATAIPTGEYRVTLSVVSPKFSAYKQYEFCGGKLPRLLGVPGFDGVLIHIGNTAEDTSGCILVGWNTVKGKVLSSTAAFTTLYERLSAAKGKITVEVC